MEDICRVTDLRHKEVINLHNGMRLGYIYDAEFSKTNRNISALIIAGKPRFFGLLGRFDDIIIPYDKISKIGEDIILVNSDTLIDF